jgi:hypothetical protein
MGRHEGIHKGKPDMNTKERYSVIEWYIERTQETISRVYDNQEEIAEGDYPLGDERANEHATALNQETK